MKVRATKLTHKGTVTARSAASELLVNPGDVVVVEREIPRMLVLRCPCGCRDDLIINLDQRSGPAWRFYSKSTGYSLYPSYWRDSDCESHFIIWSSRIYWCYSRYDVSDNLDEVTEQIENAIMNVLKADEFIHYLDIADECGLIPWECLQACKQLTNKGLCVSGTGSLTGQFRKSE
jgi:hypothetical protein